MIVGFKHKGLQEVFDTDLEIHAFRLYKLKKPPLDGYWSIDVSGNCRIVFWFEDGHAYRFDYLDTH